MSSKNSKARRDAKRALVAAVIEPEFMLGLDDLDNQLARASRAMKIREEREHKLVLLSDRNDRLAPPRPEPRIAAEPVFAPASLEAAFDAALKARATDAAREIVLRRLFGAYASLLGAPEVRNIDGELVAASWGQFGLWDRVGELRSTLEAQAERAIGLKVLAMTEAGIARADPSEANIERAKRTLESLRKLAAQIETTRESLGRAKSRAFGTSKKVAAAWAALHEGRKLLIPGYGCSPGAAAEATTTTV